jgi:hypothetical protein
MKDLSKKAKDALQAWAKNAQARRLWSLFRTIWGCLTEHELGDLLAQLEQARSAQAQECAVRQ